MSMPPGRGQFGVGELLWFICTVTVTTGLMIPLSSNPSFAVLEVAAGGCCVALWPLVTKGLMGGSSQSGSRRVCLSSLPFLIWVIRTFK
jgi:hypothetical protein